MTKREFQKAEYEAEVTELVGEKTCRTCHWWFSGECVWHTGLNTKPRSGKAKLKFTGGGILKTKADFGCTEWKREERQNVT